MMDSLVSDELWQPVEPLLPEEPPKSEGGRLRFSDRAAFTGIIYVLKNGILWRRDMSKSCGSSFQKRRRGRSARRAPGQTSALPDFRQSTRIYQNGLGGRTRVRQHTRGQGLWRSARPGRTSSRRNCARRHTRHRNRSHRGSASWRWPRPLRYRRRAIRTCWPRLHGIRFYRRVRRPGAAVPGRRMDGASGGLYRTHRVSSVGVAPGGSCSGPGPACTPSPSA